MRRLADRGQYSIQLSILALNGDFFTGIRLFFVFFLKWLLKSYEQPQFLHHWLNWPLTGYEQLMANLTSVCLEFVFSFWLLNKTFS